jgi:hypothetical protein
MPIFETDVPAVAVVVGTVPQVVPIVVEPPDD